MVAIGDIEELARRIAREFQPERVVLFGSYAAGTATDDSDVDLLVVLPFEGKGLSKALEMLRLLNPPFAVDLLARRPADTARRYEEGDPLVRDALDHGRVLYEQDRR